MIQGFGFLISKEVPGMGYLFILVCTKYWRGFFTLPLTFLSRNISDIAAYSNTKCVKFSGS